MIKKIILLIITFFLFINIGLASDCTGSQCIDSTEFEIKVSDLSPGGDGLIGNNTEETINNTLGLIIQKLMIGLGSFALIIMTIGAGYIIIYHGQDELLNKGKGMFASGIIALIIALSSYYLVDLFKNLLYN